MAFFRFHVSCIASRAERATAVTHRRARARRQIRGPSGGGKTTLCNIIGTIDRPSAGTVELLGERVDYDSCSSHKIVNAGAEADAGQACPARYAVSLHASGLLGARHAVRFAAAVPPGQV